MADLAQAITDMGWNHGEGRARRLFGRVLERRRKNEAFTEAEIGAALDKLGYSTPSTLSRRITGRIRELRETREP